MLDSRRLMGYYGIMIQVIHGGRSSARVVQPKTRIRDMRCPTYGAAQ